MSIENYYTLFYILLGVSILLFIITLILFFRLKINHVFLELTGIAKAKEIQEMKDVHENTEITENTSHIKLISPKVQVNISPPQESEVSVENEGESNYFDSHTGELNIVLNEVDILQTQENNESGTSILNIGTIENPAVYETDLHADRTTMLEEEILIDADKRNQNETTYFSFDQPLSDTTILSNGTTVLTITEDDESYLTSSEII